jgi:hypothetical protein
MARVPSWLSSAVRLSAAIDWHGLCSWVSTYTMDKGACNTPVLRRDLRQYSQRNELVDLRGRQAIHCYCPLDIAASHCHGSMSNHAHLTHALKNPIGCGACPLMGGNQSGEAHRHTVHWMRMVSSAESLTME